MKFRSVFAALIAVLLLFSACHSQKNEILLSDKDFVGEVDQYQNLTFYFNKDVCPDSLTMEWDSTDYVTFTPAVKGMFKWNSASELMFSPKDGFRPGTKYKATITNKILKHASSRLWLGGQREVHFHTDPLLVTNAALSWTRDKSTTGVAVQLDVKFNYDVDVATAATKLIITSDGKAVTASAINSGKGKTVSLQFPPLNDLDQNTDITIEVQKGIPVAGPGNYVSDKDTVIKTFIPSRYNLAITDVVAQHTGTESVINVNTSQAVVEDSLKSLITISPKVDFEVNSSDAGFVITSKQMKADKAYNITISKRMEGIFGGRMRSDYTRQVTFGKLDPAISFMDSKGMYISSKGFKNIALSIVNVPKVEVYVVKVYANNLEQFMRRGVSSDWNYNDDDDQGGSYNYYNTDNLGDTIFKKEYLTSQLPLQNSANILHLDFQDKIKDYDGTYVVCVASKDHLWVQDSKVLCVSDIGLIVKEERNKMYVFANSIKDATPLNGVKVSFVSTNNQKIFTATTDDKGVAVFPDIQDKAPGFGVGMVTAKMGDEFSFVWLNQCQVETSRFDVGGRVPNATALNAMIYAERNLYRPGETMHVSAIVRDENWHSPGTVPVKMKLIMPNGKEFATVRKTLNDQGACEADFNMPVTAFTGTYTVELFTGNDVLLNSYNISVEDFVPDRLKVNLKLDKNGYSLGDTIHTSIQADNLFGTPAAGKNYEWELNIEKGIFQAKNYPDYDFSVVNDFNFSTDVVDGKTDAKGGAKIPYHLKKDIPDVGLLKGSIMGTVFDETGRPVHRYQQFTIYTHPIFVGIKNADDYVSTHTSVPVGLIAVDKNGKVQSNVEAEVTLIKKDWNTVIQQDGNHYKYVSQVEEKIISQTRVKISGENTRFFCKPDLSGEYEVRVSIPGTKSYVATTFYAWGWDDTQYTSFNVNKEGNVTIKADKDKYDVNDKMKVLFTTPFDGRMLVTVERAHVLKYLYLDVKNKSASLSLPADAGYVPNVYITATLLRPMGDGSDMPLTVAHGFKSITVEDKKTEIPVFISMVDKSRSKTKQTITVKTVPGAYVTIAAVDEGILQVKNFQSPDPYKYFYQKEALSVNSYDIYPLLLPEIKTTRSSTGGDGSQESQMRVNPTFVNRIKLVSYWSNIKQADSRGIVKYDINIPQFSGDIRAMAVAYKDNKFGSADKHMKVADPIVISTALPRFLSPKDEVVMPISLSNTTGKEAHAKVTVQTDGPIAINGDVTQTVNIPAHSDGRVVFKLDAKQAIGAGKVNVSVNALGETFTNETDIGVRPPASLQKITGSGLANAGQNTTINIQDKFIPGTFKGKLLVSKSPLIQFTKNINDLVKYPYGCVEQTTSTAFPQLFYHDLVKSIYGKDNDNVDPTYNVQQAIRKLQSMQMPDGGLSFWPGGTYESWWGSVFATHFLLEARKAGYEVNQHTLDRLFEYLKYKLESKKTELYYYNGNQMKEIAAEEIPYSLYVLALAGQSQIATMNYYKSHPDVLSLGSKYLLASAYALAGQPKQAKEMLPPAFEGEKANTSFLGSFYSYIRDEAMALNALLDMDPDNPQIGIMARHLSEQLRKSTYLNTQENVFSILALGRIAQMANKANGTATITANGKDIATVNGETKNLDLGAYKDQPLQIKVSGNGPFYYYWEASGITADGSYKQEDKFIKVRRTYFDRNGKVITNNTFHQNDLIVVRISLQSEYSGIVYNVAVTDMLPAGFEVENTRLTDMPTMKWIKDASDPEYMDIRDDRVNFFMSAYQDKKNYYYMVRAVSPGTYNLGPVQADAMYDGSYHSYNGAGVVKILQK